MFTRIFAVPVCVYVCVPGLCTRCVLFLLPTYDVGSWCILFTSCFTTLVCRWSYGGADTEVFCVKDQ